jgi:hypothetical protein
MTIYSSKKKRDWLRGLSYEGVWRYQRGKNVTDWGDCLMREFEDTKEEKRWLIERIVLWGSLKIRKRKKRDWLRGLSYEGVWRYQRGKKVSNWEDCLMREFEDTKEEKTWLSEGIVLWGSLKIPKRKKRDWLRGLSYEGVWRYQRGKNVTDWGDCLMREFEDTKEVIRIRSAM